MELKCSLPSSIKPAKSVHIFKSYFSKIHLDIF